MKERSIRTLWLSLLMVCFFVAGIFSISMNVKAADTDSSAPEIPGLTFESEMQNDFAECFHIYYYNDDYTLIDVPDSGQFLLVPEGKTAPDGLVRNRWIIFIWQQLRLCHCFLRWMHWTISNFLPFRSLAGM